ncbi:lysophospholipid acyltransferase family protein [Anaerotignum lactatifermentans]|uniref:lysophospholipid acyltransferase family protein n=1 Tax=Anaerotignum lactatifermentans TaxID=160404 RepID=UPI00255C5053|nr:lysophospholipid acyltransferase family protein [Anaerotignum lactatifermentans]
MSFYTFARGLVKIYYKFMFRMDIQGEEHIPKEGGVVLCCNHMSNLDPTTMAAFVKRPVRYIAKKELFEKRWSAKLLSSLGAFPVDRQTTDMKALKTAIKLLKNGEALGIFAEGTRVKEGEAKAAKAGVALFALKGEAPIVPICISSKYKFRSVVHIRYGKPIYLDEYKGQKVTTEMMEEITEKVMEKVREMRVEV